MIAKYALSVTVECAIFDKHGRHCGAFGMSEHVDIIIIDGRNKDDIITIIGRLSTDILQVVQTRYGTDHFTVPIIVNTERRRDK